jgi:hypothetical protein
VVPRLDNLFSGNSLLPIGEWDTQVATLLVFSRTGWVSRQLTPKELAVSFDLPVALRKERLSTSNDLIPFLEKREIRSMIPKQMTLRWEWLCGTLSLGLSFQS